jgi:hypothetical protein
MHDLGGSRRANDSWRSRFDDEAGTFGDPLAAALERTSEHEQRFVAVLGAPFELRPGIEFPDDTPQREGGVAKE